MTFTVQNVIDEVRLRHPSFDPVTQPDPVLVTFLNSAVRRARQATMMLDPRLLQAQAVIDLPLPVFTEGAALPAYDVIVEVSAVDASSGLDTSGDIVAIIPQAQRNDVSDWPACFLANDRLYLKGSEADWGQYTALLVNYVATFSAHTSTSDEVAAGDVWRDALIAEVSYRLAVRAGPARVSPDVVSQLLEEVSTYTAMAQTMTVQQRGFESWNIRERA